MKLKIGAAITVLLAGGIGVFLFDKPTLYEVDNRFGTATPEETMVETSVLFGNPNPVSLRLGELMASYTLEMNTVDMAQGRKEGVTIVEGNNTVNLSTAITNEKIPRWWASHVANKEQTRVAVTVDLSYGDFDLTRFMTGPVTTRTISTNVLEQLQVGEPQPLRYNGETILILREIDAVWGPVSQEQTRIITDITVYNPRTTPVALSQIGYTAAMNNVTVAEGQSRDVATLPPKTERTVTVDTALDNEKLDEWWVTHITQEEYTNLNLGFDAVIDLETTTVSFTLCRYQKGFYTDFLDSYETNRSGTSSVTCMENPVANGGGNGLLNETDSLLNSTEENDTENDSNGVDGLL